MRTLTAIWLVFMIGGASKASAQLDLKSPSFPRFGVLYQFCKNDPDAHRPVGAFCMGYVGALVQLMTVNGFMHVRAFSMCPDGGQAPATNAAIQAILNWGRKHPEHWSDDMLVGAALALHETWPCQG
jgi:hypothetical protein